MTTFKQFIPAKLYQPEKGQWFVYYSFYNPIDDKMKVFRIYKNLNKKGESIIKRKNIANEIILETNEKLKTGWTPVDDFCYFEHINSRFTKQSAHNNSLNYFINDYLEKNQKNLRRKSYQTYQSKLRMFSDFCQKQSIKNIQQVDNKLMHKFFDFLKNQRSPGTYNSYFTLLKTVFNSNILFNGIRKQKTQPKPALRLNDRDLIILFDYLKEHDPLLLLFCRFIFYCFIRPHSELRYLKKSWINFYDLSVTIPGECSKNHKTEILPIPSNDFSTQLLEFEDYHQNDYIFSPDPKTLVGTNYWRLRFEKAKKYVPISKEVTLYSLKHTGAIKLLDSGASVMDIKQQMRHHSLDETEKYLRQMQVLENERIRFNNLNF